MVDGWMDVHFSSWALTLSMLVRMCVCSKILQSDAMLVKRGRKWTAHLFAGGLLSSGVSPRFASGDPGPAIIVCPMIKLKLNWIEFNLI